MTTASSAIANAQTLLPARRDRSTAKRGSNQADHDITQPIRRGSGPVRRPTRPPIFFGGRSFIVLIIAVAEPASVIMSLLLAGVVLIALGATLAGVSVLLGC